MVRKSAAKRGRLNALSLLSHSNTYNLIFFVNSSLAACVCVCLAVFNINVFFFFQLSPSNHAFSSRFVYRLPHAMEKEAIAPNGDGIIAN